MAGEGWEPKKQPPEREIIMFQILASASENPHYLVVARPHSVLPFSIPHRPLEMGGPMRRSKRASESFKVPLTEQRQSVPPPSSHFGISISSG